MSAPDSIPSVVLPSVPRLTVVPRPVSQRDAFRAAVASLAPSVVAGAGAVLILTVAAFSSKLVAVNLSSLMFIDTSGPARFLGTISFMSIVLIVAAIALLRRGLRATPAADRIGRTVAIVALAGAYLHLLLWFGRVLAGLMASSANGSLATFIPYVFWWG
ncbi:MAG: hypothetical protein AB7K08_12780 [Microbacteriaceae bacterium]